MRRRKTQRSPDVDGLVATAQAHAQRGIAMLVGNTSTNIKKFIINDLILWRLKNESDNNREIQKNCNAQLFPE